MTYASEITVESQISAGVSFTVARMSFSRRVELMRRVRELTKQAEYLEAGPSPGEKMDAALLEAEIDRTFLRWGLRAVAGLELDGAPATPETLIENGPEDLLREALGAVRAQIGLTADERKN